MRREPGGFHICEWPNDHAHCQPANMGNRTYRGAAWLGGTDAARRLFAKGEYAVLVRFLEPEVQADVESSGENTTLRQIDIVNLESGAVVKQFQDSSPLARMGVMDALYIDDTLYLISFMTPPDNPAGKAQNQQPSGWTVDLPVLSVYREGEQIFACMIQSGQQEDARVKAPEARRYSELYLQPAEGGR